MTKTLYVAGPMYGIPQYNFPLFEAVAVALRNDGYTIVSPHECDSEETRKAAWASPDGKHNPDAASESWGECLARDVKMLADGTYIADERGVTGNWPTTIDGIAFLPNWDKSKGARLEAFVGLLTGKEFFRVVVDHRDPSAPDGAYSYMLEAVTAEYVQFMLAAPWAEAIRMHTPL